LLNLVGAMKNEKLSLLAQLVHLIHIDNKQTHVEFDFLLDIARMLNVSDNDLDYVLKNKIPFIAPEFEYERILQFYRLVLMAKLIWKSPLAN
jgi:hypothetical protein